MIRIIRYVFLLRGWVVSWWLRFWLKRANKVISVSKYVQRVLDANGIESEVIYNVFDPKFALESNKVQPCLPRRQAGRGKVEPFEPLKTILFVGKSSYGKGYDLFRSLSRNKVFRDYKFVTIGGSNKLPYLETLQKIKEAAAVVTPSRWQEPFGRVALESLMVGTPVVATRRGGLSEIVDDGKTGMLAEPSISSLSAALRTVVSQNHQLRQTIQNLRNVHIKTFSARPAQQHLALYTSLPDKIAYR